MSAASAPIGSDTKLGASRLSIGYALLSRLGLPDDGRDHTLTLRHGGLSRRLAVRSPANLFEGGLNLHPDTVRALKLRTGKTYKLSYDQRIKELVVTPTGVGQGKGDANRSGGTNRSGGAHRSGGAQRSGSTSRSAGVNRSAGAKAANRSGGAKAANRSGGASDGHRSPGVPAFNPPAPAKNRSAGAARKRPAHPSIAREKTRKPVPLAAPRDDRRPTSRAAKPIRQKRSSSDPAPVFHAAKRGASGPVATPKPYMPKGRA
ncbi:hypothetical protein OMP38_24480 [Cohnella ginsengisoli]|uniref:Uncharacterized protein n=1 Tax=Cohnella ginsengisoli TaxID=425004 RepID=A0A9X4KKD5_9BACL|nr:hypothetical protein [Cohnella ginsengisoli]MDG0793633.1 hypothetical protein [Cohnella ginsengisoli]